jgi:hypothetical protein
MMPVMSPRVRMISSNPKQLMGPNVRTFESSDCKDPNAIEISVTEMCKLPPNRGHGHKDIVRIYYNPVLQQCLPFSWTGKGGNANRFVSIKNCYEICHPSDPGIRKLTGSGIRPYLAKRRPPKYCSGDRPGIPELGILPTHKHRPEPKELPKDVVIRQINNPLNPSKTLTLVQPVRYVTEGPTTSTEKPKIIIEKRIKHVPILLPPAYGPPPPYESVPPVHVAIKKNDCPEKTYY